MSGATNKDPHDKHDSTLNVDHVHVVGKLDICGWRNSLRERLLKPLNGGDPLHHALLWVVIDVVVLVDGVSKNPEVINTG